MREIKFRLIFRDKVLGYEMNIGGEWWYSVDNITWERGEIKTKSRIDKSIQKNQYTGLKDKNDKEIYEGDILLIPDEYTEPVTDDGRGPAELFNHLAPVVYDNGSFLVWIKEAGDVLSKAKYTFLWLEDEIGEDIIEVIGNIYENPELLK